MLVKIVDTTGENVNNIYPLLRTHINIKNDTWMVFSDHFSA